MKFSFLVTVASAVLLVAGCAQEEPHYAHYDETISPVYSAGRMRDYNGPNYSYTVRTSAARVIVPSDSSIATAVRESLRRNVEIAPMAPNIQVRANNGSVVLNGWVQSVEQKRQVGAIARDVTGVVAVNNQLVPLVDPTAPRPAEGNESQSTNPLLNSATGGAAENTNALTPTAAPGGADKTYQQIKPSQGEQITNNNQMP